MKTLFDKPLVVWALTPLKIFSKMWNVAKAGKRPHFSICEDNGDIPVGSFNEQTKQWEPVVNNRGNAYAARNRQKYRKNKKRERHDNYKDE